MLFFIIISCLRDILLILLEKKDFVYDTHENSRINPLSPISDQERISPYTISTISSRQEMIIKKNMN